MSKLEKCLTAFSALSQCAAALCDYRARTDVLEELTYTREALRLERDTTAWLEQRVSELRMNRDSWMAWHDQVETEKRELAAEVVRLGEEVERMKTKPKPPKAPPSCKKCGKSPCKCKGKGY